MTTTEQSTEDTEIRPMTRESFTAAVEAAVASVVTEQLGSDVAARSEFNDIVLKAGADVAWAEITRLQGQLDDAVSLVQRCAGSPDVPSHAAVIGELGKEIETHRAGARANAVEVEELRELRLSVAGIFGISHLDSGLDSREITVKAQQIAAELGDANLAKDDARAARNQLADGLTEILASIEHVPCLYYACPGPVKPSPEPRCSGCEARVALKDLLDSVTTAPASQS